MTLSIRNFALIGVKELLKLRKEAHEVSHMISTYFYDRTFVKDLVSKVVVFSLFLQAQFIKPGQPSFSISSVQRVVAKTNFRC